ncbi:MAG: hypothetical protein ACFE9S_19705 [Candidatus Hermodarchaeota archaeon]
MSSFRSKTKGMVLLILGSYFFSFNTILIIIFGEVITPCIPTPSGTYCPPLDPATYWNMWFMQYGWSTILTALGGLAMMIIGCHYYIQKEVISKPETIKY